ncbi:MAG TPA: PAS domain S-box protein [Hyphomicrobiales bacterium]|nr:PAS domain S-box protein [Hyphomicrobiales bacterium]
MSSPTDLLRALPVAIYTTDRDGFLTFYNDTAAAFWGHRPALGASRWCGSWKLFWPDGRPMAHDECPLALALREGREIRGAEAVAERPDGSRIPFAPYPTLLRDPEGRITGAINLLVDLSDRRDADIGAARLAAIVSSSDDAIISKTLQGIVTSWNAGATRIFGYQPDEMIGQSITRIIPPELLGEEAEILSKLRAGQRIDHFDTIRIAKGGRRLDISLTVSPVRDRSGTIVGASKVARDVTQRKHNEEMQRLLFDELNHRVKNTLSMIQAIASQSMRRADNPVQFVESFNGRVQALSRAHDLLVKGRLQGADVGDLVREQVVLGDEADHRIRAAGPAVMLDSRTAVQLALMLHELATNARKYGALASPGGRLAVEWAVHSGQGRELRLSWRESGVPEVHAPQAHGFGTVLIERTARASGGEAAIRYGADGIACDISLPLLGEENSLQASIEGEGVPSANVETGVLAGRRIMVIEDEPLVALEMEAHLADAGCTVLGPAVTVEAAARLIAEGGFDAALLDGNLHGRRVDDLAAALARAGTPFAFVTGYGREALPAGFRDAPLLAKPFRPEQLIAAVEALLAAPPADVIPLRASNRRAAPHGTG